MVSRNLAQRRPWKTMMGSRRGPGNHLRDRQVGVQPCVWEQAVERVLHKYQGNNVLLGQWPLTIGWSSRKIGSSASKSSGASRVDTAAPHTDQARAGGSEVAGHAKASLTPKMVLARSSAGGAGNQSGGANGVGSGSSGSVVRTARERTCVQTQGTPRMRSLEAVAEKQCAKSKQRAQRCLHRILHSKS